MKGCAKMLRRNRNNFAPDSNIPVASTAGMPISSNYLPNNVYKEVGSRPAPQLDCTDPFARMQPNKIPVPGTSVWTNPQTGTKGLGSAYDMMGLISSFDKHQRNTINPLELYACQNEGPSVLHREVQPIYEGCRRLILNGHQDIGFCCHENKIINFGKLYLDKETYQFPWKFTGYRKNEISVFLVKYRASNIILQFEPIVEFNDELFGIGQFCKSSSVVMNYFWIAWAYLKNPTETIVDFKA